MENTAMNIKYGTIKIFTQDFENDFFLVKKISDIYYLEDLHYNKNYVTSLKIRVI